MDVAAILKEAAAKKTLSPLAWKASAVPPTSGVYSPTAAYTLDDVTHWLDTLCGPFDLVHEHHYGGRSFTYEWWFHPVNNPCIYSLVASDAVGVKSRVSWRVRSFHFRADYVDAAMQHMQDYSDDYFEGIVGAGEFISSRYCIGSADLACNDVSTWKTRLDASSGGLDEAQRALLNYRMTQDLKPFYERCILL